MYISRRADSDDSIILVAEGLSKSFGSVIFRDVSFVLRRGEGLGVSGGNGSGKTTLLNALAGLEKPDSGTVEISAPFGYVMQRDGLFERLSCLDNLRYACKLLGLGRKEAAARIEECTELCGLGDFLKKRVSRCSGGMRQRLNIALAFISKPELLLLDEASSGLDKPARDALFLILRSFRERGGSFVMVSHHKEELSGLCSDFIELNL